MSSTGDIQVRSIKVDGYAKMTSDKQLRFRDDGIKIYSDTDGSLTIEADTTVKIVNPENQADGTLGGTQKLIKINIGGTPYYFRVYSSVT